MTALELNVLVLTDRAIAQAQNMIDDMECEEYFRTKFHMDLAEIDRELGHPF